MAKIFAILGALLGAGLVFFVAYWSPTGEVRPAWKYWAILFGAMIAAAIVFGAVGYGLGAGLSWIGKFLRR